MKNRTSYGKIIAITLSVLTCACAIAFVLYRLFRNLVEFCNNYKLPEEEIELDLCELDEEEATEENAEEIAEDSVEEAAEPVQAAE